MEKGAKVPAELKLSGDKAAEWKFFVQKLDIYMKAAKIDKESEEYKCAVMLNCIGDAALRIYNTFEFKNGEEGKFNCLLKKFEDIFVPTINETYERYLFFTREMKPGETVDEYVTQLRQLSENCQFGTLCESLIKDRLVLGIKENSVKDRLLRTKNLELVKAIEICKAAEITRRQLQVISEGTSRMSENETEDEIMRVRRTNQREAMQHVNPRKEEREAYSSSAGVRQRRAQNTGTNHHQQRQKISVTSKNNKFNCNKCGYFHSLRDCQAFGKKCRNCGQYNHFTRFCQNKSINNINKNDEELFIGLLQKNDNKKNDWNVDLKFSNKSVIKFRVDSGADVNVIPLYMYKKYFGNNEIKPNKTKLLGYSGKQISVLGYITVSVSFKNKEYNIELFISKTNSRPVLGKDSIEELDIARMVCSMDGFRNYFEEYSDVFKGIGCLPGQYSIKIDPLVKPRVHAARRFPQGIMVKLKSKLESLERQDIIVREFGPTEWVNSLVIVDKPDGDFRICIDPTDLNKAIKREHFTIPTYVDIISKLKDAKVFSVLDTNKGFWNIKLDSKSSKLCTFNTPFGRYRFKRLPFGLKCSSEVFQRKIMQCFENIQGVEIYVDDILVWGRSQEEHDKRLKLVLERARKFNVRFNPDRCKFSLSEVRYIGHKLTDKGIKPDESKIETVKNYLIPRNVKELQSFLGIVNYLHKFIPNVAELSTPLRELLKKDIIFHWGHEQQKVFDKLKNILTTEPLLKFYDPNKSLVLSVDASRDGLGAALLQEGAPIAYASRSLNICQRCYAQIEKEMLAIVYGAKKFHQYLYGRKVVI
ncbi:hypothetical protein Zmor_021798 [Zophobas morio]|uniref:Uncharacterized protein n=1 Tax=Zophobas morio TaxID=2755281 RepID=A0AA38MAT3_9CUCU|nr:hypothetical protein Zmor_021798 [Zophobas morio]